MKHVHYSKVDLEIPKETGAKNIKIRWLISKKDGAKNFAMRMFEVQSGGCSPLHQHDWEHEVFILEGTGLLRDKTHEEPFGAGDVVFVPAMEWHQFVNSGKSMLRFLCLIPIKD